MYLKTRDLVLISLFGFIYYAITVGLNGHLSKIPEGEYFLFPFIISILMGIAMTHSSQILEWPLCFLFGGVSGSVLIIGILSQLGMPFSFMEFAHVVVHTLSWFGLLSAMVLVGSLFGYFLKLTFNMILGSLRVSV